MHPLTASIPKIMLHVAGEPFVTHDVCPSVTQPFSCHFIDREIAHYRDDARTTSAVSPSVFIGGDR
jgi:hypothetical protein